MHDAAELHGALTNAMALHQAGRLEAAEAAYRAVLAKAPDWPDALHLFGLLLNERGDVAGAIAQLERTVKLAPGFVDALANLGNMYIQANALDLAERTLRQVLAFAPRHGSAQNGLGLVLLRTDRPELAVAPLQTALVCEPGEPRYLRNLGDARRRTKDLAGAVQAYEAALKTAPEVFDDDAYRHYARTLQRLGRRDRAKEVLEAWLAVSPGNAIAPHMLASMGAVATPGRASEAYVRDLFDQFSGTFDQTLGGLGYRGPELVREAVERTPHERFARALDAGCGTGLAGAALRSHVEHFVGVDLSPLMVEKARARAVYDELFVAELTAFLRGRSSELDLIVCADTFVYIGDLGETIPATFAALRPAGLFVFTVEEAGDAPRAGFVLHEHGRYAHSESYLRELLERAGFTVVSVTRAALRRENAEDVASLTVTARKPAA